MPRLLVPLALLVTLTMPGCNARVAAVGGATTAAAAAAVAWDAGPALVPMADILDLMRDAPWACAAYDEATGSCEAVARSTPLTGGKGTSELTVLVAETPRVAALVSAPVWYEHDRECARLADVSVQLEAAVILPYDAAEEARAVAKRALSRRGAAVTCSALVRDRDGFRSVTYDDGRLSDLTSTYRFLASKPSLRLPKRRR